MKFAGSMTIMFFAVMCTIAAAQGHEGHGGPGPGERAEAPQSSEVPASLSSLVLKAEEGVGRIREAAQSEDAGALDREVSAYVTTLLGVREALRAEHTDVEEFERSLGAAEKSFRRQMDGLKNLNAEVLAQNAEKMDEASLAAGRTLDAILIWQDAIKSKERKSRSSGGSCCR